MEPRANGFAMREVGRFWLTYPGFLISNVGNKAYAYVVANTWSGPLALYPSRWIAPVMRRFVFGVFVVAAASALAAGFERRRTFFLGWPILLNLPLFLVLQWNERYVPFVSCSMMFTAVPLLMCGEFYRRLGRIKNHLVALLVVLFLVWLSGPAIYTLLLSDRFRYWTPLFDPGSSTLNVLK